MQSALHLGQEVHGPVIAAAEVDNSWTARSAEKGQPSSLDDMDRPTAGETAGKASKGIEQVIASLPLIHLSPEELRQLNEAELADDDGLSAEAEASGEVPGSGDTGADSDNPAPVPGSREWRKAQRKVVKQQRRAQRAGAEGEEVHGRKACDLCQRRVDLLIRCTVDVSKRWLMTCGQCWKLASGGVTDGDADHPHYTYGGLWKNRAATSWAASVHQ